MEHMIVSFPALTVAEPRQENQKVRNQGKSNLIPLSKYLPTKQTDVLDSFCWYFGGSLTKGTVQICTCVLNFLLILLERPNIFYKLFKCQIVKQAREIVMVKVLETGRV